METEGSLPCSQKPTNDPYSYKPHKSGPLLPTLIPQNPF
jgi:hypothetical protein